MHTYIYICTCIYIYTHIVHVFCCEAWWLELSQPRSGELQAFRLTLSWGEGLESRKDHIRLCICLCIYIYMYVYVYYMYYSVHVDICNYIHIHISMSIPISVC